MAELTRRSLDQARMAQAHEIFGLTFCVRHLAWWMEGKPSADLSILPALLKRRVNPLGQQLFACAWLMPEVTQARIIFASRHADYDRTLSILHSLYNEGEV